MKNTIRKKTLKPVPVLQVRAEFGEKNVKAFTLPMPKVLDLAVLKASIREHCKGAIRAEIQQPGGEPEIITLSRKPASILV